MDRAQDFFTASNGNDSVTLLAAAGYNIENSDSNRTIAGSADDDSVINYGTNVYISLGAGEDKVTMSGAHGTTIDAGTDDDWLLSNSSSSVSINGGAGNDYIDAMGAKITLIGGSGNDYLRNKVGTGTLDGGAGNDSIYMDTNDGRNWIYYNLNNGDDLVFRFNVNDTLKIGNGTTDTFCSVVSGSDVNVSVGSNVITLSGAASLSSLHIAGTYSDIRPNFWIIEGNTARYGTSTNTLITITGVASDATASNFFIKGKTITIGKGAVKTNGTPVKLLTSGYTLKLGKGMDDPTNDPGTLKNGIYTFGGKTEGYSLSADKKNHQLHGGKPEAQTQRRGLGTCGSLWRRRDLNARKLFRQSLRTLQRGRLLLLHRDGQLRRQNFHGQHRGRLHIQHRLEH